MSKLSELGSLRNYTRKTEPLTREEKIELVELLHSGGITKEEFRQRTAKKISICFMGHCAPDQDESNMYEIVKYFTGDDAKRITGGKELFTPEEVEEIGNRPDCAILIMEVGYTKWNQDSIPDWAR